MTKKILLCFLITFSSFDVWGWGNRGHHELCVAATYLVEDSELSAFLKARQHRMGLLCNIPDVLWKSLPEDKTKQGNPTHYLGAEKIGKSLKDLSPIFKENLSEELDAHVFTRDAGTMWWRADQFLRLAISAAERAKRTVAPANPKEEQDWNLPYNVAVYDMHVAMGIMGHFVGDAQMPYHNSSDYDGWGVGHGGIHYFYEDLCVDEMGSNLTNEVVSEAAKIKSSEKYLDKALSPAARMKEVAQISFAEKLQVEKLDVVVKASKTDGDKKIKAERETVAKACPRFKRLIVKQLARGARMLASFWDEAYLKGGRPELKQYKSYRYPLTPDFVEPDYLK